MNSKRSLGVVLAAALAAGTLYAWTRLAAGWLPPGPTEGAMLGDPGPAAKDHFASPSMIAAGDRATGTPAPEFEARANDGQAYRLSEVVKDGPAVLVFIKDGCPCSRAADPFLQRVHTAGRGWVPFFGVIDGDPGVAEKWAGQNHTVFPILADPELKIIHAFGAESSACVAFVGRGGRIEKLWAGYSETMLRELASRMAPWVKPGMEPLEVSDAPAELYAGCPY